MNDCNRIQENSAGLPLLLNEWIMTSKNLKYDEIKRGKICQHISKFGESINETNMIRLYKMAILYQKPEQKDLTNKVIDAFVCLSTRFLELVQNLTDEMFKFILKFRSIAHSKGFQLSKMQVKIPYVGFESKNIFEITIAFPKIQSPEILLTAESDK